MEIRSVTELVIDGQQCPARAGEEFDVEDPSTGAIVRSLPLARPVDAQTAIGAARAAHDSGPWPRMRPAERAAILTRLGDLLEAETQLFSRIGEDETGTPRYLTQMIHADRPLEAWRDTVEKGSRSLDMPLPPVEGPILTGQLIAREPRGVVSAIVPWNCPQLSNLWKVAPALITGNTVVLKPSPEAPSAALELGRLGLEAGLPPGVLNVVTGGADVGEVLVTDPGVNMVTFTGSAEVGRRIAATASQTMKRMLLELGGKSAQLVLPDADVDAALGRTARLTMLSGQMCALESRLIVPDALHDEMVEKLITRLRAVRIGTAHDPDTRMGPLISAAHRDRVEHWIEQGRQAGAKVAYGGGRPETTETGYYVEPTVLTEVENSFAVAREEIFGPVLCVIRYSGDLEEGIRLANDSQYGLVGSVWTANPALGMSVARRIQAGRVFINAVGSSNDGPYGGYKQSGIGRELGQLGLEEYTEVKLINWGVV
jgi:aldehyde dehydrogenase (NAD+)